MIAALRLSIAWLSIPTRLDEDQSRDYSQSTYSSWFRETHHYWNSHPPLFMTRPTTPKRSRRRSLEITMDSSRSSSFSSPSHGSLNDAGPEAGNSSAALGRLYYDGFDDEPRHFLDCCSLCRKPLASNRNIFMYRLGVQPSLLESFVIFVESAGVG